jgi:hypothetical protein
LCAQTRPRHRARPGPRARPHKFFVLRFLGSKYLKTKCLRQIHAANAFKTAYLPKTPGGRGGPPSARKKGPYDQRMSSHHAQRTPLPGDGYAREFLLLLPRPAKATLPPAPGSHCYAGNTRQRKYAGRPPPDHERPRRWDHQQPPRRCLSVLHPDVHGSGVPVPWPTVPYQRVHVGGHQEVYR